MSRPHLSTPRPASDAVIDDVQVALQRLSPRPYGRDDAREALHNLGRFFDVLERWSRVDAAKAREVGVGRLGDAPSPEPREPR